MTFQVIPRERSFFDLLERAADGVVEGARELSALVDDLPHAAERNERIQELEHAGDDLTHQILRSLNTTFVPPFDRHDIHRLASSLDDILDGVEAVADLLTLMRIDEPIHELRLQADVLVKITKAVYEMVGGLRSLEGIDRHWADISRLEREGDRVYRRAVADLYSGDHKAMDVLKWKGILHEMEAAIDRCEDIANTVESIALKHA